MAVWGTSIALLGGARAFDLCWPVALFADDCYIIPRRDGRVVVGATEEPSAGFSRAPTAAGTKELLDRALRLVPSLAEYELEETWAGLRPTAPDLVRPPRAAHQ